MNIPHRCRSCSMTASRYHKYGCRDNEPAQIMAHEVESRPQSKLGVEQITNIAVEY